MNYIKRDDCSNIFIVQAYNFVYKHTPIKLDEYKLKELEKMSVSEIWGKINAFLPKGLKLYVASSLDSRYKDKFNELGKYEEDICGLVDCDDNVALFEDKQYCINDNKIWSMKAMLLDFYQRIQVLDLLRNKE